MEVWKDVVGYNGIYEVSDDGRVRTCEGKTTYTQRHGVRHWKQRILKQKVDKYKNHRVTLWQDGKPKDFLVHRLVADAFLGIPAEKLTVNHIDGNRENNKAENLEWLSLEENIREGFKTGLYPQRKIVLKDETGKEFEFRSMSECGRALGFSNGYISECIRSGRNIRDKSGKRFELVFVGEKSKRNIYEIKGGL